MTLMDTNMEKNKRNDPDINNNPYMVYLVEIVAASPKLRKMEHVTKQDANPPVDYKSLVTRGNPIITWLFVLSWR